MVLYVALLIQGRNFPRKELRFPLHSILNPSSMSASFARSLLQWLLPPARGRIVAQAAIP